MILWTKQSKADMNLLKEQHKILIFYWPCFLCKGYPVTENHSCPQNLKQHTIKLRMTLFSLQEHQSFEAHVPFWGGSLIIFNLNWPLCKWSHIEGLMTPFCPSAWKASSNQSNISFCPKTVLFVAQMWNSIIKDKWPSMTRPIKTFSRSAGYKPIDVPDFREWSLQKECPRDFIWHVNCAVCSKSVIAALKSSLDTNLYKQQVTLGGKYFFLESSAVQFYRRQIFEGLFASH